MPFVRPQNAVSHTPVGGYGLVNAVSECSYTKYKYSTQDAVELQRWGDITLSTLQCVNVGGPSTARRRSRRWISGGVMKNMHCSSMTCSCHINGRRVNRCLRRFHVVFSHPLDASGKGNRRKWGKEPVQGGWRCNVSVEDGSFYTPVGNIFSTYDPQLRFVPISLKPSAPA